MKVLHVCFTNRGGGGAIGAYRLHKAMLSQGIDSRILVIIKGAYDPTLMRAPLSVRLTNLICRKLSSYILNLQKPADSSFRSLNIFPTGLWRFINATDADIVQLHWINENTLGISELKRIRQPIVWKLPDMWAFSGCEHYPTDSVRPFAGYNKSNKNNDTFWLDLDRFVWNHKKHQWKDLDLTIVTPSKWLAACVKSSYLFKHYPVYNILNPINLEVFRPAVDIEKVRAFYRLPSGKKLILYSSMTMLKDPRKGFAFLEQCLRKLAVKENHDDFKIVIMGNKIPYNSIGGIEVINMGYLADEIDIAMVYSAVDVCAAPSYADNLPNTIKESMACGTPCVAFRTGGVPDMITHKENGYLADVNNIDDFCNGLMWVLTSNYSAISNSAREAATRLHNPGVIVGKYLELYGDVLKNRNHRRA
ncbi:MAG: glycosyltransferase [Gammaproteobacteria bacterium]